jgi:actin-like ATPase involved in cell morphogenesis
MSIVNNIIPIGIDLGTSTIKVSYKGKRYKITSIIGEPNPGFRGVTPDTSWENNLIIRLEDGTEYYIGELARMQSLVKYPLAREGRMKNAENAQIAIKAAMGLVIDKKDANLVVATGVPVATGKKEMENLGKFITGKHEIEIKNDATGEAKKLSLRVLASPVIPEPYGAYYYMLKKRGETKAMDSIIVDIGFGSTDILTIYKGTILATASGSIPDAVDTLVTKLAQFLSEKTAKIIKPESLMVALERGDFSVNIGGVTYDVKPQITSLTNYIAKVIIDEIDKLLDNLPPDARIKYFILEGGGIYFFGQALKQHLLEKGLVSSVDDILIPDDPVMANALGFELVADFYSRKLSSGK